MTDYSHPLAQFRQRHGLGRQQVADKIGVSVGQVGFYERDWAVPSPQTLRAIFLLSKEYGEALMPNDFYFVLEWVRAPSKA